MQSKQHWPSNISYDKARGDETVVLCTSLSIERPMSEILKCPPTMFEVLSLLHGYEDIRCI